MHRIFLIIAPIECFLRLFGLDVDTQFDDSGRKLLDFGRSEAGPGGCRSYWGFGLDVCVSKPAQFRAYIRQQQLEAVGLDAIAT